MIGEPIKKKKKINSANLYAYSALLLFLLLSSSTIYLAYLEFHPLLETPRFQTEQSLKHYAKELIAIFSFCLIIALPLIFQNRIFQILYFVLIILLIAISALADLFHTVIYQSHIDASALYSIFATNTNESIEYSLTYFNIELTIVLTILFFSIIAYTILFKLLRKIWTNYLALFLLFSSVGVLFWLSITGRSKENIISNIPPIKVVNSFFEYKSFISQLDQPLPENINTYREAKHLPKETCVFVIGESTSIHHMGIYGYERNTNPLLQKIKHELLIHENFKAPHAHTILSLIKALTFADSGNIETMDIKPSLIDLFNSAGFETTWISNQKLIGENETPVTIIARRANNVVFPKSSSSKGNYDEILLPELQRHLTSSSDKKAIFVHLMGTHLDYSKRYPIAFNKFQTTNYDRGLGLNDKEKTIINQYDNAILYNDSIIFEIINALQKIDGASSMIYFSDHGDEVYDFRKFHGHAENLLSKYMTDIPFILWMNQNMRESKDSLIQNFIKKRNLDYGAKHSIHSMQGLFDIKNSYYDESKDLFGESYGLKMQRKGAMPKMDSSLQSNIAFDFEEKIWLHRVNSIKRLKSIEDLFVGIELDIIFNMENEWFDVVHPPEKPNGLILKDFIKKVEYPSKHYFWLDLKNLNNQNNKSLFITLNNIISNYQLKEHVIIESDRPEYLKEFVESGYKTSYYLPNLHLMDEENMRDTLDYIIKTIQKTKITAISQSIDNLGIMNEHFKDYHKLLWDLKTNWQQITERKRIETLLEKDSTIQVILVRMDSEGYR